jgi:hypothetical protein
MLARLATMVQDVGILTTGFFESVGKDREAVERTVVVDTLNQFPYRAVVPAGHGRVENDGAVQERAKHVSKPSRVLGAERVLNDFVNEVRVRPVFSSKKSQPRFVGSIPSSLVRVLLCGGMGSTSSVVTSCLTTMTLFTIKHRLSIIPGSMKVGVRGEVIRKLLCDLNSPTTSLIFKQVPNAITAVARKQSEFPTAAFDGEMQHSARIGASQPFRLSHVRPRCFWRPGRELPSAVAILPVQREPSNQTVCCYPPPGIYRHEHRDHPFPVRLWLVEKVSWS